ncbi:SET domain-containing protein 5 [Tulasnella sp. 418]|nr:SET domain-containing protein 5 [Tulasnella sp. 418]
MTSTGRDISPSDEDLLTVVHSLRENNGVFGAKSLLSAILASNPTWTLSEKRLRKLLQREGLTLPSVPPGLERAKHGSSKAKPTLSSDGLEFPHSQMNDDILTRLEQFSKKVEIKFFDAQRGKGIVAKEPIEENEVIWKEDPFVHCPAPWELQAHQSALLRCAFCLTSLPSPKSPPIPCPASCGTASWCTRLCYKRHQAQHTFLCPQLNPAVNQLWTFVIDEKWIALGAWMRVVALLLAEWVDGKDSDSPSWKLVRGLAEMSMKERVKLLPNWQASAPTSESLWKQAHSLFLQAFDKPDDPVHSKKLSKLKKGNWIPAEMYDELLGYEGFLRGLGKMSLNLGAYGGIYALHSHLNHCCAPNVSARHFDPELGRITVIAKKPISPGTELLVSYVDPSNKVRKRQRELREWGFGICKCEKCVEDEKLEGDDAGEGLEDELRGFLGV